MPTETFTYDADNEAFLKKLSQSEAVNKRVQDTIVRDAVNARARERLATATEADVQAAIHAKLTKQLLAEEEKRSKAILREKEKAGREQIKLAERQAREEKKARDKALAEEAKKQQAGTFLGKIKGVQQSPFIAEAETIASLGITAGGAISKVSMLATSAIRPLAFLGAGISALGPAGLAAAAGIAAVAAPLAAGGVVLSGLKAMANGAVEARARLAELGKGVSSEQAAALGQYAYAVRDLGIAMDRMAVAVGTGPARELALFTTILADSTARIVAEAKAAAELAGILRNTLTGGVSWAAEALGGELYEALTADQRAFVEARYRAEDLTTSLMTIAKQSKLTAAAVKGTLDKIADQDTAEGARQQAKADEELRKAKEALAEAQRRENEASRDAAEIRGQMTGENADILAAIAAQKKATEDALFAKLTANAKANASAKDLADFQKMVTDELAASEAATKAYAGSLRQVGDAVDEYLTNPNTQAALTGISDLLGATADLFQMQADAAIANIDRISARQDKLREEFRDYANDRKGLSKQIANAEDAATKRYFQNKRDELDADKEANDAKIEGAQKREDNERRLLIRSFNRSKAASIAQIAIQTAVAAITALGPPLGPIAGAIAAAGIVAAGGIAAAKVAAQKPPEAPMGRPPASSPDHPVRVAIQREEAVLSKQGVRTAGGPSGVTALNNGTAGGDIDTQNVGRIYVGELVIEDRGGRRKTVNRDSGKKRRGR